MSEHALQSTPPPVEASRTLEELEQQRANFVGQLVGSGLISDDLANSGELDSFIIDEATSYDALQHILVGDKDGGAHHLPTAFALDRPEFNVIASSQIRGSKRLSGGMLRKKQEVRSNGTYHPRLLSINGDKKDHGSAMFPNEWNTEAVIRNTVLISRTAPASHDLERSTLIHEGNIDGVDMRVITSEKSGKIITGYPLIPRLKDD